jgi:hypothetical protein
MVVAKHAMQAVVIPYAIPHKFPDQTLPLEKRGAKSRDAADRKIWPSSGR